MKFESTVVQLLDRPPEVNSEPQKGQPDPLSSQLSRLVERSQEPSHRRRPATASATPGAAGRSAHSGPIRLNSRADKLKDEVLVFGQQFYNLELHGHGGLGEVFAGIDGEVNRRVAVKLIRIGLAQDATAREQFLVEAKITGRLQHPGIVPVYGMGRTDNGDPFYVMPFVRGVTLHKAIRQFHEGQPGGADRHNLAFRKLLGHFVSVCQTIGYAHDRGVVHRDIKPSNVMVGKYGETLVIDWGLAIVASSIRRGAGRVAPRQRVSEDQQVILPGEFKGTPAYMSPECVAGDPFGRASDIYSLGAVLYELMTGGPPIDAENFYSAVNAALCGDFPRPREVDRGIPAALEAICLKAMSFQAESRYPSATDLALDVERWLADQSVSAYRDPWTKRAFRWVRSRQQRASTALRALWA